MNMSELIYLAILLLIGIYIFDTIKKSSFYRKITIKKQYYNLIKKKQSLSEINRLIQSSFSTKDYIGEVSDLEPDFYLLLSHTHKNTNEEISKYFYALYLLKLIENHNYIVITSDENTLSLYKKIDDNQITKHGLIKNSDELAFRIELEIDKLKFP